MSIIASVDVIDHPSSTAMSNMTSTEKPTFTFLPLGAIIQKFQLSGLNIVQGFDGADDYIQYNDPYFSETIGRVANRISGAKIERLNGRSYSLAANNGPNCLHGGVKGWGKQVFEGPFSIERSGKQSTAFKYLSKDGDEGFPGSVEAQVFYTATTTESEGRQIAKLEVEYEAELVGDGDVEETAVAMTNHRSVLVDDDQARTDHRAVTLTSVAHQPLKEQKSHCRQIYTRKWTTPTYRQDRSSPTLELQPTRSSLLELKSRMSTIASSSIQIRIAYRLIHDLCRSTSSHLSTTQNLRYIWRFTARSLLSSSTLESTLTCRQLEVSRLEVRELDSAWNLHDM